MFIKRFFQLFILVAVLAASFATASNAFAWSCGTSYTVIGGDTLRQIALNCGTTIYALRRANPQVGGVDLIYPGQVLLLPGAQIDQGNGYAVYIVARGNTLKSLAAQFGTSMDILISLNPDIYNPNVIYEGQRLTVPSGYAVPTPPPNPQPVPSYGRVYTVQWGDTMRKIADRLGINVDDLIAANPQIWNPNWIYAGQQINLPAAPSYYTIQRGDTLKIIAVRYGTSIENILALNPQIGNADWIYAGQVIRLW